MFLFSSSLSLCSLDIMQYTPSSPSAIETAPNAHRGTPSIDVALEFETAEKMMSVRPTRMKRTAKQSK